MMWPWRSGERCHACLSAPVQRVVKADAAEGEPGYRVCRACKQRLMTTSLRPLEWYNLAARYGPQRALLHDDMYLDDGTADQPKVAVVDAHLFPAPTLDDVRGDAGLLVEYAFTTRGLGDEEQAALAAHDPRQVLDALDRRIDGARRADARDVALEICATALGTRAGAWVRGQWSAGIGLSWALIHASACCLPHDEGLDRVIAALDAMPPRHRPWGGLRFFRSERTLDWIERNVQRPVTEDWGELAAESRLTWERAARWLDQGRPLSLVALDGVYRCVARYTPFRREQPPELVGPMPVDEMIERLTAYAQADPAHRPESRAKAIIQLLERARGSGEAG